MTERSMNTTNIIDREGRLTYACTKCGNVTIIPYSTSVRRIEIKCSCGNKSVIDTCYRSRYRKITNIRAVLQIGVLATDVKIVNMSVKGFCCKYCDLLSSVIKIGMQVKLYYTIPDEHHTFLCEKLRIVNIDRSKNLFGAMLIGKVMNCQAQKAKCDWVLSNKEV